jgi:hypothetical protein
LHRLGLEYHKPNVIPSLGNDEVVLFADAVHPTHAARPVGCWAPKQDKLAIEQTSGRERIKIHGAINLESGQTRIGGDNYLGRPAIIIVALHPDDRRSNRRCRLDDQRCSKRSKHFIR